MTEERHKQTWVLGRSCLERIRVHTENAKRSVCGIVGAIRVVDGKDGNRKRISPIFVLPRYQNIGIAQKAIQAAEEIYGDDNWKLETILQEEKNRHLYEKM